MRPTLNLLVLAGALLLGGCIHPPNTPPPVPAAASSDTVPPAFPSRLLHIYVDCALPDESRERNHALAETVALTLRDQLRQRGYDVRGAEATVREGATATATSDAITRLSGLAHAVACGTPPPTTARYATYLHPNAPRLLLFVALEPADPAHPRPAKGQRLGGLLADSATGEILWSDQAAMRTAGDDQNVRRLAIKLLNSLAAQPTK